MMFRTREDIDKYKESRFLVAKVILKIIYNYLEVSYKRKCFLNQVEVSYTR